MLLIREKFKNPRLRTNAAKTASACSNTQHWCPSFREVGELVKTFYRERDQDFAAVTPGDQVSWSCETWYTSCTVCVHCKEEFTALATILLCDVQCPMATPNYSTSVYNYNTSVFNEGDWKQQQCTYQQYQRGYILWMRKKPMF